jgi:hypothetical protein
VLERPVGIQVDQAISVRGLAGGVRSISFVAVHSTIADVGDAVIFHSASPHDCARTGIASMLAHAANRLIQLTEIRMIRVWDTTTSGPVGLFCSTLSKKLAAEV